MPKKNNAKQVQPIISREDNLGSSLNAVRNESSKREGKSLTCWICGESVEEPARGRILD